MQRKYLLALALITVAGVWGFWVLTQPKLLKDGAPIVSVELISPVPDAKIALRRATAGMGTPQASERGWVDVKPGQTELNPDLYYFRLTLGDATRVALIGVDDQQKKIMLK